MKTFSQCTHNSRRRHHHTSFSFMSVRRRQPTPTNVGILLSIAAPKFCYCFSLFRSYSYKYMLRVSIEFLYKNSTSQYFDWLMLFLSLTQSHWNSTSQIFLELLSSSSSPFNLHFTSKRNATTAVPVLIPACQHVSSSRWDQRERRRDALRIEIEMRNSSAVSTETLVFTSTTSVSFNLKMSRITYRKQPLSQPQWSQL